MFSTYDQWKLRSPDDERWCNDGTEPEFECSACEDIGWLPGPCDCLVPCTECSGELTQDDLDARCGLTAA